MKMLSCTGGVSLFGLMMMASLGVSEAARETLSVTEGGITFTVARYDDGRNKPYRLKFRDGDTRSRFMFDSEFLMTNIKVGDGESYSRQTISYGSRGEVEGVEVTPPTRRDLVEEENDAAIEGRRLEFDDCTSCEDAWVSLCAGSFLACQLVGSGIAFSAEAEASVITLCETFGSACEKYDASEACQDQCTEEEVGGSSSSSSGSNNPCLDPSSEDYMCAPSPGDTSMRFTSCDLTEADVPFLPACFEEYGKTNILSIRLDETNIVEFPDGTFAGLSELTSLDLYSNKLVTVSEGLFSGLTKLEFLDLAWNDLARLPVGAFSDLASLQTVRLFNNELRPETLPHGLFAGTPLLQSLSLDSNSLKDLTVMEGLFDGLTELRSLGFSESGVETVPAGLFAGLSKLEYLSFWVCSLTSLPDGLLSPLTALQTLELSENDLTDLGTSLSGLTELRTLRLGYNNLLLPEDIFFDLVNLEELELEGCRLTTLPAGLFSPLVNLVELHLGQNGGLKCLPSSTATDIRTDKDLTDGTCECTPPEAVFCDDGLSCQSGMTGYTCAA